MLMFLIHSNSCALYCLINDVDPGTVYYSNRLVKNFFRDLRLNQNQNSTMI